LNGTRILIIEDDAGIRSGVCEALRRVGYQVVEGSTAAEGTRQPIGSVHLALLDVMLPDGSGLQVLNALRQQEPWLPIILLTARGEPEDRVRGLRSGADDYIVKPFGVEELLARVEAVLRRSIDRRGHEERLELSGRAIDMARREVVFPTGVRTPIPEREFALLAYLATHADRAVSREELLARVWGIDPRGMRTRSVDMAVARLRELLGDDSQSPQVIATVRGLGYKLVTLP
jgi:two-component system, OmpR family, alkaline phosphatase synthesis response regulator PhoP